MRFDVLVGVYEPLIGSYKGFSQIELGGKPEDLFELSDSLASITRVVEIPLHSEAVDPSPYDGVLETLRVEVVEEGKLRIKRSGKVLGIRGNKEDLEILAHNIRVPALESLEPELHESSAGHTHIEWYPGNYYLSEDSDPLVVAANKP